MGQPVDPHWCLVTETPNKARLTDPYQRPCCIPRQVVERSATNRAGRHEGRVGSASTFGMKMKIRGDWAVLAFVALVIACVSAFRLWTNFPWER